jgi:hypothetical protein
MMVHRYQVNSTKIVTVDELDVWAPHAYYHAKNVYALQHILRFCKERVGWRCFFHDIDEYTITSDQKIWAYISLTLAIPAKLSSKAQYA